jgi:hypothetical protein
MGMEIQSKEHNHKYNVMAFNYGQFGRMGE